RNRIRCLDRRIVRIPCQERYCKKTRPRQPPVSRPRVVRDIAMRSSFVWVGGGFALGVLATLFVTHQLLVQAQQTERPGNTLDNPVDVPRDLSGLSIKNPRIRVV